MNFKVLGLVVAVASIQSMAAFAKDTVVTSTQALGGSTDKTIVNPSKEKIVGSDSTTFERRTESGAMPGTTKIKSITHGGDSSIPIDRMPGGGPLGGSGVSTGAKIPGPSGTINHKSELPSTKEEVGGGAVGAPAN